MLGISFDTPEENKAFRDKFDFPYDLLCDVDRAVGRAYGAEQSDSDYPARISYLIDPEGRIERVYAKVVPAEHPDQVLADLG